MDKKKALTVLISHSYILSDEAKKKLLAKVHTMSDQDIDTLGKFLAMEKKKSIEENQKMIEEYDKLIESLEESDG